MARTIDDIPEKDVADIKSRLINQIQSMNEAEIRIAGRSKESLAYFVAESVKAIAKLFGYVIALPLAWANKVAESIWEGLKEGWKAGWRSVD